MERKANESFEQYKSRRAAANIATKNINRQAPSGGVSTRRELRSNSRPKGTYGANILKALAERRATPARLAVHKAHVERLVDRKARRAAPATNDSAVSLAA